ncbi:MAG: riboflavin synthase [Christensenellaceae bacterium]|nr:riboflavin synthase [Christensenellaceae bacterium]
MFTGIIEEIGSVQNVSSGQNDGSIGIKAGLVLEGTKIGDSIAVNGVCLTVTSLKSDGFTADIMPETLRRSNLGALHSGDPVNLERAMSADGRFGGHIVTGHIDGVGTVIGHRREGIATRVTVAAPQEILRYIVEKGSIAIDGISLTVAAVTDRDFSVSLIPHTGDRTVLLKKGVGSPVNLENDIVGKYVARLMQAESKPVPQSRITLDFLRENGY